jgi:hypothetical protein
MELNPFFVSSDRGRRNKKHGDGRSDEGDGKKEEKKKMKEWGLEKGRKDLLGRKKSGSKAGKEGKDGRKGGRKEGREEGRKEKGGRKVGNKKRERANLQVRFRW